MPTVRINIKVSTSDPRPESLGSTFEVNASGVVDVFSILRDRIHEMAPTLIDIDTDADSEK